MAAMMTETATEAKALVSPAGESTCDCGQALELCHAAHCPRCGVTLRG
jgi:hypothetical protein